MRRLLAPALALLAAPSALAEGPVGPHPQGESPEEQVAKLAVRISKALKENEEALTRIARGEQGAPKPVDIRIPPSECKECAAGQPCPNGHGEGGSSERPGEAAAPGGTAPGGSDGDPREALRGSAEQGHAISSSLDELLRLAGEMGGGGGGGGSRESPRPEETEGKQEPKKPGDGDPESREKDKKQPEEPLGKKPPSSEKDPPREEDPRAYFFAKLPDKVKEAILNGDFDQVPEKYRDLVAEWTKALGEKDRKEAESPAEKR